MNPCRETAASQVFWTGGGLSVRHVSELSRGRFRRPARETPGWPRRRHRIAGRGTLRASASIGRKPAPMLALRCTRTATSQTRARGRRRRA